MVSSLASYYLCLSSGLVRCPLLMLQCSTSSHNMAGSSCQLSPVTQLLLYSYLLYSEHVLILILFPTVRNRGQFVVPEVVPWSKVGDALGYYFLSHTGRGLTHLNLDYLGQKLYLV